MESEIQTPPTLSPSNSGRRRSTDPNSPEFEFWMVRNPSFPQPNLLSADQLFNNGVLLPLQLLSVQQPDPPDTIPDPEPAPESVQEPDLSSGVVVSTSKRWRDIFKMGEKKSSDDKEKNKDKEKKKDRKNGGGGNVGGATGGAELNINIWPFSRSHSAGVGGNRPKVGCVTRKVSSAPCSRSNSAGESKSRKWPNSPGRAGIHLSRNSPVWQVRRSGSVLKAAEPASRSSEKAATEPAVRSSEKVVKKEKVKSSGATSSGGGATAPTASGKGRVLNLNVPTMCIGYRHQLSCRSDESSLLGGGGENGNGGGGNSGVKLFKLRTLFTKKVY